MGIANKILFFFFSLVAIESTNSSAGLSKQKQNLECKNRVHAQLIITTSLLHQKVDAFVGKGRLCDIFIYKVKKKKSEFCLFFFFVFFAFCFALFWLPAITDVETLPIKKTAYFMMISNANKYFDYNYIPPTRFFTC